MKKRLLILIILGLVSACANPSSNFSTPTPTTIVTRISTNTPIIEYTATPSVQVRYDQECWQIKPLQDKKSPSGSLVYLSGTSSKKSKVYYWNISSSQSFPIKIDANLDILTGRVVSPDGKSIARWSDKGLAILSEGKVKYYSPPDGVYISRYLPDGQLMLTKHPWNHWDDFKQGIGFTDIFYLLDPSTGNITEHSVFLPMFVPGRHDYVAISYSPDLHYVVYGSTFKNSGGIRFSNEFTLFDVEKNEKVWTGPPNVPNMTGEIEMIPGWNPETNSLIYIYENKDGGYGNYYSITLDGKAIPLTDFKDMFVQSWGGGYITSSESSPDGRYIVFFGDKESYYSNKSELFIFDSKTNLLYKTCIPQEGMGRNSQSPDWYFDGSQFIINFTSYKTPSNEFTPMPTIESSSDLLFDIPNKTIYKLPYVDKIDSSISSFGFPPNEFLGWVAWEIP